MNKSTSNSVFIKALLLLSLFVSFSSCSSYLGYCISSNESSQSIVEDDFVVDVITGHNRTVKEDPYLNITIDSPERIIKKVQFKGQEIENVVVLPVFIETNDTLYHAPERDYIEKSFFEKHYYCNDFPKKVRKNKHLNLKIEYDLDSLGTIIHKHYEYVLVKKRIWTFGHI